MSTPLNNDFYVICSQWQIQRQRRGGPGLKCPVPPLPLPPLLLDFLQRFLESAGGYRKNSSNPMISRAYQATNGMSIVVEPRTTLFNFGFQTFFPSINWNSILDSDFDGGGWIYAAAPALPSADAINKPNVTLQQWQLAAVFHWEAPPAATCRSSTKSWEIWRFLRNILFLCRRNVFHAAGGEANCILIHCRVRGSKYLLQVLTWTAQNLTFACMFIFQTLWFYTD